MNHVASRSLTFEGEAESFAASSAGVISNEDRELVMLKCRRILEEEDGNEWMRDETTTACLSSMEME